MSAHDPTHPTPQRLGHYLVDAQIGDGGLGVVFRARDADSGHPVAIKSLDRALTDAAPERLLLLEQESRTLRRLGHPNIAEVLELFTTNDTHHIVVEYLPGGSLAATSAIPWPRLVAMARALAEALAEAHAQGLVHQDVKPANVLLTADGTPKLVDFGTTRIKLSKAMMAAGFTTGSPNYLSPEVLRGHEARPPADVWALGVTLFELLAGRRPFEGSSLPACFTAIIGAPPLDLGVLRPDLPRPLVDLVSAALHKDPAARATATALASALSALS